MRKILSMFVVSALAVVFSLSSFASSIDDLKFKINPDDGLQMFQEISRFNKINLLKATKEENIQISSAFLKSEDKRFRYIYEYNTSGNNITEIVLFLNDETSTWDSLKKVIYTYNYKGQINTSLEYQFAKGAWKKVSKEEFKYNNFSALSLYEKYLFNEKLNDWIPSLKTEILYNNNNEMTENTTYEWFSTTSVVVTKNTYSYEKGKITSLESIKTRNGIFVSGYKETFSYEGTLLTNSEYFETSDGSSWSLKRKSTYQYDENKYLSLKVNYEWNNLAKDWQETYKEVYLNDDLGTVIVFNSYIWNDKTQSWERHRKKIYNYVLPYTYFYFAPYYVKKEYKQAPLEIIEYYWVEVMKEWLVLSNIEYTYTSFSAVGLNENTNESFKIYPNPVSDVLHINIENAITDIYNINGQKVISTDANKIDVSMLPSGIYNCVITKDNEKITQKFIKQ